MGETFAGESVQGQPLVVRQDAETRRDVVVFGATVEVEDEDGKRSRYTLVGADESDPSAGKLSWKSPVGRALLKKKVGDVVTVARPAGEIELEIIAITIEVEA